MEENITKDEKIILETFTKLLSKLGYRSTVYIGNKPLENRFGIYKDEEWNWILYHDENGERYEFPKYESLYDLCIDFFCTLDKNSTDYSLEVFPYMVNQALPGKIMPNYARQMTSNN